MRKNGECALLLSFLFECAHESGSRHCYLNWNDLYVFKRVTRLCHRITQWLMLHSCAFTQNWWFSHLKMAASTLLGTDQKPLQKQDRYR